MPFEPSAQAAAAALSPRHRKLAFVTLLLTFVMEILDGTIMNVALPSIRTDLAATSDALQWMVAGYATTFAMLLVSGGRMGDVFGYRRMIIGGMAAFTLASALCGVAQTPTQLVVARLLQGAAAACMGPQVMALVQLLYAPRERVQALAMFGLFGGLAAVMGPIVGGSLIEANIAGLGWRSIFLVNLPIGIAIISAAIRLLPAGRAPQALRIDWIGNMLMIAALFALIFPLVQGRTLNWPVWCIVLLASTPCLLGILWHHLHRRVARNEAPLIEPSLFRERSFGNGLIVSLLLASATGAFLLILTLLLQVGLGLAPFAAGLIHVPFALGVALGIGLLGRKIVLRLGRDVLPLGAGLMICGIAALVPMVHMQLPVAAICIALFVTGLGMGTATGPLSPIALSRIDTRHAGSAGGTLQTMQQLGNATGTAVVGSLFFWAARGAQDGALTRAAFAPAALLLCLLLTAVVVLSRRFPKQLFDPH